MKSKASKVSDKSSKNFSGKFLNFGINGTSQSKKAVPPILFYSLAFVAFGLPNLVFSGVSWFDTLHIMKWTAAMVPVALISAIGGIMIALYGSERTGFRIDLFGWLWLIMLGYISLQPLWTNIISWSTYMKEWFFFAVLFALYIFCFNLFKDPLAHRTVLWLANINAGINVVFAELLIREMNGPFPFIMNVPGNYIGNTGQQEMFGLWMAMAVMNGIYLNAVYVGNVGGQQIRASMKASLARYSNILLLSLNAWGMWNSTTRAGFLSLITGTLIISIIFITDERKEMLRKVSQGVLIVILMLVVNIGMTRLGFGRAYDLLNKTMDMVMNTSSFGKRRDIWKTSWAVATEQPLKGLGIGQYKWHYLKGQKIAIEKDPGIKWQFTYWAHNEYLQWFAEFGIFGALLMISAAVWWIWMFIKALTQKKILSSEASWACAMLFLILFDAIFSRPFHRIENILWLSLAFAIANREILPFSYSWSEVRHTGIYRIIGAFIFVMSLCGLVFLGYGLAGNKYMRYATKTENARLQAYYIHKAKSIPMTRDEAEEQYAYHLLAVAKVTKTPEDWSKAINQLYRSFTIRPQAKQLLELFNLARQTGNQELIKILLPYLPPPGHKRPPVTSP
jgi:O-antigen ligase